MQVQSKCEYARFDGAVSNQRWVSMRNMGPGSIFPPPLSQSNCNKGILLRSMLVGNITRV